MRLPLGLLLACLVFCGRAATAQTRPPASAPASDASRLLNQNLTLLTGNNTLEARRIGARGLLSAGTDGTRAVADVLRRPDDPLAHLALCQELAVTADLAATLIEPVLDLLDSPREDVCAAAAAVIARYPRSDSVPRLARQAASSAPADRNPRRAAIIALGRLGDSPDAIAALIRAFDQADADLTEDVLDAFERATGVHASTADEARRWWEQNGNKDIKVWLLERSNRRENLFREQEARIGDLSRRLAELSRTDYLRRDEAEKSTCLLAMLSDAEPAIRQLGLELTNGLITDRRPVPADVAQRVRGMASDPQVDVRRAAVGIIGDLREAKDAALLCDIVNREPVARVRAAALRALGRIGDAAILPIIQAALKDANPEIVAEAVGAMGNICERSNGNSAAARSVAAAALLARFESIHQNEISLLAAFIDTMGKMGDRRFDPLLMRYLQSGASPEVRQAALRAAAARNDSALSDQIVAALADESAAVRLSAASAMGRCGKSDGHLAALLQRFEGAAETDGAVRAAAWEAFQRVWQTRAIQDRVRWADRLAPPADASTASRRASLYSILERELAQAEAGSAQRRLAAERLADALLVLGQPEQALTLYQSAQNGGTGKASAAICEKLVRAAVRAEKADIAAAVIARCRESMNDAPASLVRVVAAAANEGRALLKQNRRDAAESLSLQIEAVLHQPVPDDVAAEWSRFRRDLAAGPSTSPATTSAPNE